MSTELKKHPCTLYVTELLGETSDRRVFSGLDNQPLYGGSKTGLEKTAEIEHRFLATCLQLNYHFSWDFYQV